VLLALLPLGFLPPVAAYLLWTAINVAIHRPAKIRSVTLNGRRAHFTVRHTNRGQEVLVDARAAGSQRLEVTTA